MKSSKRASRGTRGSCACCGTETVYAWVDTRCPKDNVINLCIDCMNKATVTRVVAGELKTVSLLLRKEMLNVTGDPGPSQARPDATTP